MRPPLASKDKSAASAQERSVAQELGNGVLYSDSMCAASNSFLVRLLRALGERELMMTMMPPTEATKSWLCHRSQSPSRRRLLWA